MENKIYKVLKSLHFQHNGATCTVRIVESAQDEVAMTKTSKTVTTEKTFDGVAYIKNACKYIQTVCSEYQQESK